MPLQRPLTTQPLLQNYANSKVTHHTSYIFADSNTIATPQMLQNYINSKMARHTNVTIFLITIPLTTPPMLQNDANSKSIGNTTHTPILQK